MGNVRHGTANSQKRRDAGFTLVELMVVVALVAIIAMIATPSWRNMQVRSAIRTMVNDYTLSLYFARTEAVRQNAPVTVCPSSNGSSCTDSAMEAGWIVMVGLPAAAAPLILQDTLPRNRVVTRFTNNAQANRAVTFLPNGRPVSAFAGNTLQICPVDTDLAALSRNVVLNRTARINNASPGTCPFTP